MSLYGYDPASNVTSVSTTLGGAALSLISATYSPADQVKTLSETLYTPTGTAVAKSSSYGYLNDGSLSTRTVDGNTTSYGYLLNGAEQTTSPWTGGSFTSTHFPSGDLASQALPNGANVTQTYDTANRLASRAITNPVGATLSSWLMPAGSYDNDGNIVSQTVTQVGVNNNTGSPVTGVARLAYDRLDRLTSFTSAFGSSSTSYTLDDAGNVTFDGAANYAYSANRLQSRTPVNSQGNQPPPTTYGYDHVGNQTTETNGTSVTTTTYDAAFHPLRMSSPDGTWVQYAYDGLGRMARRQDSTGAVTLFFHDGFADQIAEETDASGTGSVTRYLLDSSGAPLGTQAAGQVSFYVSDPRGNLTQMLNATAAVVAVFAYDPFGNALSPTAVSGTAVSRLRFQMGPQDPKTGEYNLGPRLYNPQVNRFVGADLPAASAAGLATQVDPLTGNAYMYAGANPAGLIDDGYGPHIGHWLSSAAHFVRKALNNPVVKGVAIGVTIAATVVQDAGVCVGTVGGGCPEVVAASVEEDAAAIGGIDALAEAGGELAAGAETTSEAAANIAPAAPEAAGTSEVALGAEEAPNADATAAGSSEAAGNADAGASGSAAEGGRGNIVYRGLAEGQNPAEGLSARAPDATDVSPIQHVAGKAESPWISTTKDVGVATSKYGKFGVVGIDLSKVGTEVVDISGGFPDAPGMLSNWARADQEVLIRGYIPPEAIIWSNLP